MGWTRCFARLILVIWLGCHFGQTQDLRFGQIVDPDLRNSFLEMKARASKTVVGLRSNNSETQSRLIPEPKEKDLYPREEYQKIQQKAGTNGLPQEIDVGGNLIIKERQLGKTLLQQNPDDETLLGYKNDEDFVPLKKLSGANGSSNPTSSSSTTIDPQKITSTLKPEIPPTPQSPPPNIDFLLPQIPVKSSTLYGLCEKSNGSICFAYPEGCISSSEPCRMASAIHEGSQPGWIKVTLAASAPRGFVAIGFSEDRWMGDDVVVHCDQLPPPYSTWMTLHLSRNEDYGNVRQPDREKFFRTLKPLAGFVQDNDVIACEFELNTMVHMNDKVVDLINLRLHLFLAFGRHSESLDSFDKDFGKLKFHHMTAISVDAFTMNNLNETRNIVAPRDRSLFLYHAVPYILAFSFLVPCAMYIAKYGREAYSNPVSLSFLGGTTIPAWMLCHAVYQLLAVILSIIGLIGILLELEGVWRSVTSTATFHSIAGIGATVLLWTNFLLGGYGFSMRGNDVGPPEGDKMSMYSHFTWAHWLLGNSIYWCGVAALLVAHCMRRIYIPCMFWYVVALQLFVHCATHIFMSFHTYWLVGKINGLFLWRRVLPGPMIPFTEENLQKSERKSFSPIDDVRFDQLSIWCGRRRSVIFYFITAAFCCIGLIGILYVPLVLCRLSVADF